MSFSHDAWNDGRPWYEAMLEHPFVAQLGNGELNQSIFYRYLVDDAHYLVRFSKALGTVATRWPTPDGGAAIARFAAGAIDAERELHSRLLAAGGIDLGDDRLAEPTPTCLAYASTLQAQAAHSPVEVAMAGLIPCFRVYTEIGQHFANLLQLRPDHPYAAWLATYGDPEFAATTRRAEELVDRVVSEALVDDMRIAYAAAMRFEWMFWDASWRGEAWPKPR